MDAETARALINEGEGQRVEFKQSFAEEREAIITLCAFAHADGGTVFFGVKNNGDVIGAHLGNNTLENLANNIRVHTDPPLVTSIETLRIGSNVVVAVTIQKARPDQLIYAYNTPYVRVGKTNQVLSPEQQRARLQAGGNADARVVTVGSGNSVMPGSNNVLQMTPTDAVGETVRFLRREAAFGTNLATIFLGIVDDLGKPYDAIDWLLQVSMKKLDIRTNPEHFHAALRRIERAGVIQWAEVDGIPVPVREGRVTRYPPRKVHSWVITEHGKSVLMRLTDEVAQTTRPNPIATQDVLLMPAAFTPEGKEQFVGLTVKNLSSEMLYAYVSFFTLTPKSGDNTSPPPSRGKFTWSARNRGDAEGIRSIVNMDSADLDIAFSLSDQDEYCFCMQDRTPSGIRGKGTCEITGRIFVRHESSGWDSVNFTLVIEYLGGTDLSIHWP